MKVKGLNCTLSPPEWNGQKMYCSWRAYCDICHEPSQREVHFLR
uniref:Uncharacterized protein n=1 Tax=Anguilla anguilla TaxID=7936 RepID=A0A0E9S5Q2_ANGAN